MRDLVARGSSRQTTVRVASLCIILRAVAAGHRRDSLRTIREYIGRHDSLGHKRLVSVPRRHRK